MALRGILFDLDGTLVDRGASLDVFARELADAFCEDLNEIDEADFLKRVREADGCGYREKPDVFRRLRETLPWAQPPDEAELRDFWYTTYPKCTRPMAGLYDVLETLGARGLKLGIITNGNARSQEGKIERLDLHTFMETVVISESAGVEKPDAAIFDIALSDLDLPARDVWFVGDHPDNDIAGAEAAGLTGVWISGHLPWPKNRNPPAKQIAQLGDLLAML